MSYVTGIAHFKVGFNRTLGFQLERTYNYQPVDYRFNNGVPNQITEYATPYTRENQPDNDLGLLRPGSLDDEPAGPSAARCGSTTSRPASRSRRSAPACSSRTATSPSRQQDNLDVEGPHLSVGLRL